MCRKFTPYELNTMDHEAKNDVICQMQDRLDKLEHDYEKSDRADTPCRPAAFWPSHGKLSEIEGQLSFLMKQKKTVMKAVRNRPLMRRWPPQVKTTPQSKEKGTACGGPEGFPTGRSGT